MSRAITTEEINEGAQEALADPRTYRRVLLGEPVRGKVAERCRTVAYRRGHVHAAPERAEHAA
jgi:hypothetical protein